MWQFISKENSIIEALEQDTKMRNILVRCWCLFKAYLFMSPIRKRLPYSSGP